MIDPNKANDPLAHVLKDMDDEELEIAARDYLWLAEQQDSLVGRTAYTLRRDLVVAESERRNRMDIVERIRGQRKDEG